MPVKNLLTPRVYRFLNFEMAISDTPDRTYVLERSCGVCFEKGRVDGTIGSHSAVVSQLNKRWDID